MKGVREVKDTSNVRFGDGTMMSQPLERRASPRRRTLEEHGIVSIRVRPGRLGCGVELIDVCAAGALVESEHQLCPGASIEVHMAADGRCIAVRGRVLRCSVSRLRVSGVWYRGAIGFDRRHPWFIDQAERGYLVPMPETQRQSAERGGTSRLIL
jgi:hypothetical protein